MNNLELKKLILNCKQYYNQYSVLHHIILRFLVQTFDVIALCLACMPSKQEE